MGGAPRRLVPQRACLRIPHDAYLIPSSFMLHVLHLDFFFVFFTLPRPSRARPSRPVARPARPVAWPSRPVWRVNWSLNDDPSLFQPVRRLESEPDEAITTNNAGQRIFLRCERQTIRRLPVTGWVLFTIKTHVDPLSSLAGRPDIAEALAGSIRSLPDGSRRYKNIIPFEKSVLAYLDSLVS